MDPQTSIWIPIAQVVGIGISGFISGFMVSATVCSIPPMHIAPSSLAVKQWQVMYDIGKVLVPPLSVVSTAAYFFLSYHFAGQPLGTSFLAAGICTIAILPYTFLHMFDTIHELEALVEGKKEDKDGGSILVKKWARLNLIRAIGPTTGTLLGLCAVTGLPLLGRLS